MGLTDNDVETKPNGIDHVGVGRQRNGKGGDVNKRTSKARYAVVDAYPPPKEQLKRKQREFTQCGKMICCLWV